MVPSRLVALMVNNTKPWLMDVSEYLQNSIILFGMDSRVKYHRKFYFMVPQEGSAKLRGRLTQNNMISFCIIC